MATNVQSVPSTTLHHERFNRMSLIGNRGLEMGGDNISDIFAMAVGTKPVRLDHLCSCGTQDDH